jgi:uncharacterized membrane protein
MNMKTHNILMAVLAVVAIVLIFFGPALNVGAGFGLLLLICPLMMLGMMFFMGKNHGGK